MPSSALESHFDQYSSKIVTDMKENLCVDNFISVQPTEKLMMSPTTTSPCDPLCPLVTLTFELGIQQSQLQSLCGLCPEEGTADNKTTVNVLGLQWNTLTDTSSFMPKHISSFLNLPTKREVLSNSSKISPVTIRAKLLMQ